MLVLFIGVNLIIGKMWAIGNPIMRVNRKLVFGIIWVEGFRVIRLDGFL